MLTDSRLQEIAVTVVADYSPESTREWQAMARELLAARAVIAAASKMGWPAALSENERLQDALTEYRRQHGG